MHFHHGIPRLSRQSLPRGPREAGLCIQPLASDLTGDEDASFLNPRYRSRSARGS